MIEGVQISREIMTGGVTINCYIETGNEEFNQHYHVMFDVKKAFISERNF